MQTLFKQYISTSVDLAWHCRLFRDTHFLDLFELETNASPKHAILQALKNPTSIFLIKQKFTLYHVSFINYLWISKRLVVLIAL